MINQYLVVKSFFKEEENSIIFFSIIIGTILIAYIVNKLYNRFLTAHKPEDKTDLTNAKFLKHIVLGLIYTVGFASAIYAVPKLHSLAATLLAGAGILAVVIGFASQQALSNIIGGTFIVLFKPIRINDRIKLSNNVEGVVEDITLRHTVIRDYQNKRVVVPNSVLSNEVITNSDLMDAPICNWVEVRIGYDADIEKVRSLIAEEARKHPKFILNPSLPRNHKPEEEVIVRVIAWEESSIKIRAWVWAKDISDAYVLKCDLLETIKNRFEAEGIRIPFPTRSVIQMEG